MGYFIQQVIVASGLHLPAVHPVLQFPAKDFRYFLKNIYFL